MRASSALYAILLAALVSGGAVPSAEAATTAPAATSRGGGLRASSSGEVPDLYLKAGDALVVSMPNLTRVAVGDVSILVATVVSPNEVLIQGAQIPGNPFRDYRATHFYVWSGTRRYVYRVVVFPSLSSGSDSSPLPAGISRFEIESDRIVLFGSAPEGYRDLFRQVGFRAEAHAIPADTGAVRIRGTVREGMTQDEVNEVLGRPLTERVIQSQGSPPRLRVEYATHIVDFIGGRAVTNFSLRSDAPSSVGVPDASVRQITYRFRYAEPAEVLYLLRNVYPGLQVEADAPSRSIFVRRDSPDADAAIEIARRLDDPVFTGGISIVRDRSWIATGRPQDEFAILLMSPAMRFSERLRLVQGLLKLENELVTVSSNLIIRHVILAENFVLLRGDKGLLDVLVGYAMAEGVGLKPADIEAAARAGAMMRGMTRSMIEDRGFREIAPPRARQASDGRVLWEITYDTLTALYHRNVLVSSWDRTNDLYPGLSRAQVDAQLGAGTEIPSTEVGVTQVVRYGAGEATFLNSQLALFKPLGALPPGITMADALTEPTFVLTSAEADALAVYRQLAQGKQTTTAFFTPRSRRAEDLSRILVQLVGGGDTEDINFIVDPPTNTLLAVGRPDKVDEARRYLRDLDQQATTQVLIEAKFVELTRGALRRLGVAWGIAGQNADGNQPFANFGGSGTTSDGGFVTPTPGTPNPRSSLNAGGTTINQNADNPGILFGILNAGTGKFSEMALRDLDLTITALEDDNLAEVLSAPRIVAINNETATLQSIERIYDITFNRTIDATSGQTQITAATTEKEVGITLRVSPTVGRDGIIQLAINTIVSRADPADRIILNDAAGSPIVLLNPTTERNANSRVMVRSGSTIVIGGLLSENNASERQGVPILSHIPILGRLFRTDGKREEAVDLVIFLTARVVPADGTIADVDLLNLPTP